MTREELVQSYQERLRRAVDKETTAREIAKEIQSLTYDDGRPVPQEIKEEIAQGIGRDEVDAQGRVKIVKSHDNTKFLQAAAWIAQIIAQGRKR